MRIDPDKCTFCLECLDYCPMNAILKGNGIAEISQEECVECGVCLRANVCPTDAIFMPEESLIYPRRIRALFSNPPLKFPDGGGGRGTQEMKSNDVTGRYKRGEYAILLEFGRPGIGTRLSEIEKVTKVLTPMGVHFEEDNPTYYLLIEDKKTGKMKAEFMKEKVLSAIIEFKLKEHQLGEIVEKVRAVLEDVDTVVSWAFITRFAEDGTLPVLNELRKLGFSPRPNAKINMGLGRPLIDE
jgi:NAD-dependent dihydropyrimidine dehydrogenase PreA subunit